MLDRMLASALFASLLLGSGAAFAQPAPADASQPALGDVARHEAAVVAQLRDIQEAISDTADLSSLESQVALYRQRVLDQWAQTDRLVRGTPRRLPLEALANSWHTLRIGLGDLQATVDERVQQHETELKSLDRTRRAWSGTLERARAALAPASLVERAEATLGAIDATRAQVEGQHTDMLTQQAVVGSFVEECGEALDRIESARVLALKRVFVPNAPPIWKPADAEATPTAGTNEARPADDAATRVDSFFVYVRAYAPGFALTLGLLFALTLALYRVRGSVGLPASAADVLHAPFATALLVVLLCTRPLRPDPPLALQHLLILLLLPAALTLLRPLLDARLARALVGLAGLLVLNVARGWPGARSVVEQVELILGMGSAAGLLLWLAAYVPGAGGILARSPRLRVGAHRLLRLAAAAALFAAFAAALGYLELAGLVGGGGLDLLAVAIGLLSIRVAASGVLALTLVKTPLARLRTVELHRASAERAIGRVLDLGLLTFWVFSALRLFELQTPVLAALGSTLDARLRLGALDVSVGRVLALPAVVIAAWLTSRAVVFVLEEDVYPRLALPRGVPYALSAFVRYGMLLGGFLAALAMLGLDLTHLTVLVSAFGLGVGFGLQQLVNNFVAGLVLLFERPVQTGDSVQLGPLSGDVMRIGLRSSTIRTSDGAEVVVPNSSLTQEQVTNWTLSDRKRRVSLVLRVALGSDAERILGLLLEVARREPRVLAQPAPEALFMDFGATYLEFQLRIWTEERGWMRLHSDLAVAAQQAMREAGIEAPDPRTSS